MKYTTVLFDLDGTLTDTLDDLQNSVNYALSTAGCPPRTKEQISAALGYGAGWLIEKNIPGGTENPDYERVLKAHREYYPLHSLEHTKPYEGIMELLKYLTAHDYKIAVVSNKPHRATVDLVRQFFGDYVSVAIGEKEGLEKKPAPDMVKAALRELWSEPFEAVYIGDTEVDLETAKNSGTDCILVSWGFRPGDFLRSLGTENIAKKPSDIIKLV